MLIYVKQIPNIELSANSWLFKSYGIKCKKNPITSNYLDWKMSITVNGDSWLNQTFPLKFSLHLYISTLSLWQLHVEDAFLSQCIHPRS